MTCQMLGIGLHVYSTVAAVSVLGCAFVFAVSQQHTDCNGDMILIMEDAVWVTWILSRVY